MLFIIETCTTRFIFFLLIKAVCPRADLVKGLADQGAYDIEKQFIDFLKARETKKETETKPESTDKN